MSQKIFPATAPLVLMKNMVGHGRWKMENEDGNLRVTTIMQAIPVNQPEKIDQSDSFLPNHRVSTG